MANNALLYVLFLTILQAVKTEYIPCSGYVNTLETDVSVRPDLSNIKVAMYRDGALKDTTTCNPDGSFFISVDDGPNTPFSLHVKATADAVFEPSIQIIDPKENITLCDAKINFIFMGFSISSQVVGKYSNVGPIGFPVDLELADGTLVKSVITTEGGHYKFNNVYPGEYTIKVGKDAKFLVEKASESFKCKIGWNANDECSSNTIVISGYSIKGTLGKHLIGVTLGIFVKNKKIYEELATSQAKELASKFPKIDNYYLLYVKEISNSVNTLNIHRVNLSYQRYLPETIKWLQRY